MPNKVGEVRWTKFRSELGGVAAVDQHVASEQLPVFVERVQIVRTALFRVFPGKEHLTGRLAIAGNKVLFVLMVLEGHTFLPLVKYQMFEALIFRAPAIQPDFDFTQATVAITTANVYGFEVGEFRVLEHLREVERVHEP